MRIEPTVEADYELFYVEVSRAFELIDFAQGRIWSSAAGIRHNNRSRNRSINIANTNRVNYATRICTGYHRKVMR